MAHQIRPLDPLASQIGEHDSDLKYIQEVLYYLDSRMRAALSFLNNVQNDPLVAEFILTGIAVELVRLLLYFVYTTLQRTIILIGVCFGPRCRRRYPDDAL